MEFAHNGTSKRVCVLEDDSVFAGVFSSVLRAYGFVVESFDTPDAALRRHAASKFDAFVADWELERCTSERFLRELMEQAGKHGLTIFLLSGRSPNEESPHSAAIAATIRDCAIQYRQKPYPWTRLAKELAAAISSHELRRSE